MASPGPGEEMLELIGNLYPITRSITGEGVRETLRRVGRIAPITLHEVPSGTPVLDWEVPREWNIRDAYIADAAGERLVDFRRSNLHVVSYSMPVRRRMSLEELRPHLHSDPARPQLIPYRTSYYAENWGFCLSHEQMLRLAPGNYEVVIDSSLEQGSLTYGEAVIPGKSPEEVLFYTHTCHPSLCNDNLSGIAVCAHLARWLNQRSNRYTYRVVFGPGTIGSITWLARNRATLPLIRHGLVVALLGNREPMRYKQTRSGGAEIDRVAGAFIANEEPGGTVIPFSAWGYDERQFGSPGFALPVGRLTRAPEEGYPQYHSSGDDLALMDAGALDASLKACQTIVGILELNERFLNTSPFGEPQLGRRGIYRNIGGSASAELQKALLWLLTLSDGEHDLARIYQRSGLRFAALAQGLDMLRSVGLLEPLSQVLP